MIEHSFPAFRLLNEAKAYCVGFALYNIVSFDARTSAIIDKTKPTIPPQNQVGIDIIPKTKTTVAFGNDGWN
jgi:hypothetical protein